jgi:hypothetical protein
MVLSHKPKLNGGELVLTADYPLYSVIVSLLDHGDQPNNYTKCYQEPIEYGSSPLGVVTINDNNAVTARVLSCPELQPDDFCEPNRKIYRCDKRKPRCT